MGIKSVLASIIVGKSAWASMTIWGLGVLGLGEAYCLTELPYAAVVCDISFKAGAILATLGIRRAVN